MRELLEKGAASVGAVVDYETIEKLVKYLELLGKWNSRINLVASDSPEILAVRHVVDSLAVVPHIPSTASRGIDVGSGAGLPGAIVAMCTPHLSVVALEPVRKKAAFLSAVAREIGVPNLLPATDRLEKHDSTYDVAMSRAAFALPTWLERARRLVPDGTIIAMEGAEQFELPEGATRHPYPLEGRTRAIVVQRSTWNS
jgi:16S rRNA (guanine527-N7)-methyltransferase